MALRWPGFCQEGSTPVHLQEVSDLLGIPVTSICAGSYEELFEQQVPLVDSTCALFVPPG